MHNVRNGRSRLKTCQTAGDKEGRYDEVSPVAVNSIADPAHVYAKIEPLLGPTRLCCHVEPCAGSSAVHDYATVSHVPLMPTMQQTIGPETGPAAGHRILASCCPCIGPHGLPG